MDFLSVLTGSDVIKTKTKA